MENENKLEAKKRRKLDFKPVQTVGGERRMEKQSHTAGQSYVHRVGMTTSAAAAAAGGGGN